MLKIKSNILLFLMICDVSYGARRIQGGIDSAGKPYVVYLLKADISPKNYDAWICGGAIISEDFVITSAACVEDVKYMYVISGYIKYVAAKEIENDECTSKMKKKVIFTCVPVSYTFDPDILDKWAYIDIALVKIESPFDFMDINYEKLCSYKPAKIDINFDPQYQMTDTDAMVLGWGHEKKWRKISETTDFNSKTLQYTPILIMDKEKCKEEYKEYPNMNKIIDYYMICSIAEGNLNSTGHLIKEEQPTANGCNSQKTLTGLKGTSCEEKNGAAFINDYGEGMMDNTRRKIQKLNGTYGKNDTSFRNDDKSKMGNTTQKIQISNGRHYSYSPYDFIRRAADKTPYKNSRRNGICQNDHGGPVVTWVGTREVIIAVASVFKVNENNECIGPFLYTSTHCNGNFINCVLTTTQLKNRYDTDKTKETKRQASDDFCDSPPSVKGFDQVETHISWKDHPAGPAENEVTHDSARYGPNSLEVQNQYAGSENLAAVQYASNDNLGAQGQYDSNDNLAAHRQYAGNDNLAAQGQFTGNNNLAAQGQYAGNDNLAAHRQYAGNGNSEAQGQYAGNDNLAAQGQFAGNGNSEAQGQYASNDNLAAQGQYGGNENLAAQGFRFRE